MYNIIIRKRYYSIKFYNLTLKEILAKIKEYYENDIEIEQT